MGIPNQTGITVDTETRDMIKELAGDRPIYLVVKELAQAERDRRMHVEQPTGRDILVQLQAYLERQDKKITQYEQSQKRVEAVYAKWDAIEKRLNSIYDATSLKSLRKRLNDWIGNESTDEVLRLKTENKELKKRLALLDRAEEQKRAFPFSVGEQTNSEVER